MPREPDSTLVDRVKLYIISSGTGAFTLGDAVRAYRGVEALRDGETYSYAVENGSQYEIGRGEYVASLTSLSRSPTASSNGGAVVDFPTNSELALTALASDLSVVSAYVDAALATGFGTWAELQSFAPEMQPGDRTFVSTQDTGTHIDEATATEVTNSGVYEKQSGFVDPVWLYPVQSVEAAEQAEAWAQSPDAPDPSDPFSQSAKSWAEDAAAQVASLSNFYKVFSNGTILGYLPGNVAVRYAGFGSTSKMVFGLDDNLRWFANSFYTPNNGGLTIGSDRFGPSLPGYANCIYGPAGKPVWGVTTADGVTHAQSLRVYDDAVIRGSTVFEVANVVRGDKMPRLRNRMMRRLSADTTVNNVLATYAAAGDSWTNRALYLPHVTRRMQAIYGDGGTGFWAFGTSTGLNTPTNGRPTAGDLVSDTTPRFEIAATVGTWAWNTGYTAPTANCCEVVSAASGNRLLLTASATNPTINTVFRLLYRPVPGSSIRYSWDGGTTWQTTLDLSSGYVASLVNVPSTAAWTLLIEDNGASARPALTGLNMRRASGFLVHKVGSPGSTSSQWAAQAGTAGFQAHWAELAPDAVSILHGTNDQTVGTAPATVAANFVTIAAGIRTAWPLTNQPPVDMIFMAPAENLRLITPTMASYATAIRSAALTYGAAFLSLQASLGFPQSGGQPANTWWQDNLHPDTTNGGPAMGAAVFNFIDL